MNSHKLPSEGWCNLYLNEMPSTWYSSRQQADRMSGKQRIGVLYLSRSNLSYDFEIIPILSKSTHSTFEAEKNQ